MPEFVELPMDIEEVTEPETPKTFKRGDKVVLNTDVKMSSYFRSLGDDDFPIRKFYSGFHGVVISTSGNPVSVFFDGVGVDNIEAEFLDYDTE